MTNSLIPFKEDVKMQQHTLNTRNKKKKRFCLTTLILKEKKLI
jgi:hypothetical protein